MSTEFSIALATTCVLIVLARFVLPQLPIGRLAVRVRGRDVVLIAVGIAGLTFHCTAMFFPRLFDVSPALAPLVDAVNAMSVASIALYMVPVLVLLIGFRHQYWVALAAMILPLIAVGLTMYLGSSLRVHLVTIFIAVVAIVGVLSLLVRRPRGGKNTGTLAGATNTR